MVEMTTILCLALRVIIFSFFFFFLLWFKLFFRLILQVTAFFSNKKIIFGFSLFIYSTLTVCWSFYIFICLFLAYLLFFVFYLCIYLFIFIATQTTTRYSDSSCTNFLSSSVAAYDTVSCTYQEDYVYLFIYLLILKYTAFTQPY